MASIPNNYDILTYTATAGQDLFTITWPYQEQDDVFFTIDEDDSVRISGDYSLTPAGVLTGGELTLDVPLTGGEAVVIYRKTDIEQLIEYLTNGKITATMLQNNTNNIFYILQDLAENYLDLTDVDKVIEFIDNTVLPAIPDASETEKGLIEIATQSETDAETDDTKAVTPLKMSEYVKAKIQESDEATAEATNITKSLSGNGVVSGLGLRLDGNVVKVEVGYGYSSESRRYGKKPSDITVYPTEITEELEFSTSWGSDGIKHLYIVNTVAPYFQETIAEPPTNIHIYLGYALIEGGNAVKVFTKPNVFANITERFNLELQRNTRFKDLSVELDTLVFDRGVKLNSGYTIISNACNYNGDIGNTTYADIDKIENAVGTSIFWEVGFDSLGINEEIISSSSSNVNQTELINRINDGTSGLIYKNLTNEFTNLRVLLSSKGELAIQRGQFDYADVDTALAAITTEDYTLIPSFSDFTPIYALTVQAGVTTFADAVLTELVDMGNGGSTNVDYIEISPITSYHELHPDVASQYDILIEAAGQQDIPLSQRPDLVPYTEYIKQTSTGTITLDPTDIDESAATQTANSVSGIKIGSVIYFATTSAEPFFKIIDGDTTVNTATVDNASISTNGTTLTCKTAGQSSEVYYGSVIAGSVRTRRINMITGVHIDSQFSHSGISELYNSAYNTANSKYLLFCGNGTTLTIKSTVDNLLYNTEYSSSVNGVPVRTPYNGAGHTHRENGLQFFDNGYYYLNFENKNVIRFEENNLSTPEIVHTYTSSSTPLTPVMVKDGEFFVIRGVNSGTNTIEYSWSSDGSNWTDNEVVIPVSIDGVYAMEVIDSNTIMFDTYASRKTYYIKDYKTTPVLADTGSVLNDRYRGFILVENNGDILRVASLDGASNTLITARRFNRTITGGTTFDIPDRTSENDSKGRWKIYLNAGKQVL